MTYEWDPGKAAANAKEHRITFEEAASVFLDPAAITFWDPVTLCLARLAAAFGPYHSNLTCSGNYRGSRLPIWEAAARTTLHRFLTTTEEGVRARHLRAVFERHIEEYRPSDAADRRWREAPMTVSRWRRELGLVLLARRHQVEEIGGLNLAADVPSTSPGPGTP